VPSQLLGKLPLTRLFVFSRHRKDAGIPKRSLHVLRHTCATFALSKGIDLTTVARRLGHAEVTVLQPYSHLRPERG
jgi:site-specific recombinase XerD